MGWPPDNGSDDFDYNQNQPNKRALSSEFNKTVQIKSDPRSQRMVDKMLRGHLNSEENEKSSNKEYSIKLDEAYGIKRLKDETSKPRSKSRPAPVKQQPLPHPLTIPSGFYFDDEQLGWELLSKDSFGEPQSVVCRIALPQEQGDIYNIVKIEIPIQKDNKGLFIFDDSRLIRQHEQFENVSRSDALLFTAGFANSSVKNPRDYENRDLPRLNERDPAFISFLKSIDIQIGDSDYKLSDISSFSCIEDIITHPSLAHDIPEGLKPQDVEVELGNGTTLTRIGKTPEPRKRNYLPGAEFKTQTYVRDIRLDDFVPSPVPQIPEMPALPAPDKYAPGKWKYVFNRATWQEQKLYNAFIRELEKQGLKLVSMDLESPNQAMSGCMEFQDIQGRREKFTTCLVFSADMLQPNDNTPYTEFTIMDHEIGSAPKTSVSAHTRSASYRHSTFKDQTAIDGFAVAIALVTAKTWNDHHILQDLNLPGIIQSAKMAWDQEMLMPHRSLGPVLHGPLKDIRDWAEIDDQLRDIHYQHVNIRGVPANLLDLLKKHGIGRFEHDAQMGRYNNRHAISSMSIEID